MKKYRLIKKKKIYNGKTLYRIKALKSFKIGNKTVGKGDIGGFVESERNLSQKGNCWVNDDAMVYGNAKVFGDAQVYGKAIVFGHAKVYGDARVGGNAGIFGNAKVYDNAQVSGNAIVFMYANVYGNARVHGDAKVHTYARVYGNAEVYDRALVYRNSRVFGYAKVYGSVKVCDKARVFDYAQVYGRALVYDNAVVCGNAKIYGAVLIHGSAHIFDHAQVYEYANVYGNAKISGNARVYDHAKVFGNALVGGKAEIFGTAHVETGELTKSIKDDLVNYIACSLDVYPDPMTNTYTLYKRVIKIGEGVYCSEHDKDFIYKDGEIAEVENPNMNFTESYTSGIHASTLPSTFFLNKGKTFIEVEVHLDDIITCMSGKIRAKKVRVIGEVKELKKNNLSF